MTNFKTGDKVISTVSAKYDCEAGLIGTVVGQNNGMIEVLFNERKFIYHWSNLRHFNFCPEYLKIRELKK